MLKILLEQSQSELLSKCISTTYEKCTRLKFDKSCAVFQSYASTPSVTPDDDVFRHLALTYSRNHPTMHQGQACKQGTPSFKNGITNGAAWYPLTGS